MAIDDPLDAVHSQYDLQPTNPLIGMLMAAAAKLDFTTGLVNSIGEHFWGAAVRQRVEALLAALEGEVRRNESSINEVQERMSQSGFRAALLTAAAESVLVESQNKIQQFARVLGFEVARPDGGVPAWEDAAAFIRNLAQLGESDIEALRLLYTNQCDISAGFGRVPSDPNVYTDRLKPLLASVDKAGLDRDDFYSRCARLTGFGLTLEVQRNDSRQSPSDHCFRLTARGKKLIQVIEGLRRT